MKTKLIVILLFSTISILFSQNSNNNIDSYFEESKKPIVKYKNIVKFNYLRAALNGNACFSYERYVSPLISVELEGGLTYYNLFGMIAGNMRDSKTYIDVGYKFGYSAGVGVRFYPKKNEMEGLYIQPGYRFLQYKHLDKGSFIDIKRQLHDNYAILGYQIHAKRFSFEYYIGSGVRFSKLSYMEKQNTIEIKQKRSQLQPLLLTGFKIGYFF
jgi:hypothetical protein